MCIIKYWYQVFRCVQGQVVVFQVKVRINQWVTFKYMWIGVLVLILMSECFTVPFISIQSQVSGSS